MTSNGPRARRIADAEDDKMILPEHQVAAMHNELDKLHRQRAAIDAEIDEIQAALHTSGEARLRKQRRNNPSYEDRLRKSGHLA